MIRLYHIGLTVSDLERSIAFYRDVVGMEVEYLSDLASAAFDKLIDISGIHIEFCYLTMGEFRLQLIEYIGGGDDVPLPLKHNKIGNPHLSFWVDDVEAKYAQVGGHKDVDITSEIITQENKDIGARTFYINDPDGVQVEFCQKLYDRASRDVAAAS